MLSTVSQLHLSLTASGIYFYNKGNKRSQFMDREVNVMTTFKAALAQAYDQDAQRRSSKSLRSWKINERGQHVVIL